ncbi:MAG: NAD(P)H-binding protein, partial [Dehalococcoidia bacterium]
PVCKAFLENGFNVRLLLHRKKATKTSANCECIWGDVLQPDSLKKALEDVDAVVHLAGYGFTAVISPLPRFAL